MSDLGLGPPGRRDLGGRRIALRLRRCQQRGVLRLLFRLGDASGYRPALELPSRKISDARLDSGVERKHVQCNYLPIFRTLSAHWGIDTRTPHVRSCAARNSDGARWGIARVCRRLCRGFSRRSGRAAKRLGPTTGPGMPPRAARRTSAPDPQQYQYVRGRVNSGGGVAEGAARLPGLAVLPRTDPPRLIGPRRTATSSWPRAMPGRSGCCGRGRCRLGTAAVFATGLYRPFGIAFYPPGPNPR